MATAKDITVKPITSTDANKVCRRLHYSGKVVPNSQLHLGVFLDGRCEGVMQFGPSMSKKRSILLVTDTPWNGFIELNRMAFSAALPKNSESRAIGVALRIIRKQYPHIQWVLSFADGTQCGDGTIYRASGFYLTAIKTNTSIIRLANGETACKLTYGAHHAHKNKGSTAAPKGSTVLPGFQFRYVYFLDPTAKERLTVPILPFSKIQELNAGMYLGKKRAGSTMSGVSPDQGEGGGAIPTPALQIRKRKSCTL